ncbi:hypothetical protein ACHAWC_005984 [Mediolabrus comicus]
MITSNPHLRRQQQRILRAVVVSSRCRKKKYRPCNNQIIVRRTLSSSTDSNASEKTARTAGDDTLTVDGEAASDDCGIAAQVIKPRPIFPWRSSPYPLPRLVMPKRSTSKDDSDDNESNATTTDEEEYYDSDYFTKGGPLGPGWFSPMEPWFRGALYAYSMHIVLGVGLLQIVLPWKRKGWEENMEWCFCEAFLRGVNGMIYDTYMINECDDSDRNESVQSDESFDLVLDFDHTIRKHKEDSITSGKDDKHSMLDKNEEHCMLQYNLRQLYQSAREHSLPSDVNIVLRTEPIRAEIESMFPVFGLSRKLVSDHPNMRHSYRNLAKTIQRKQKEKQLEGKNQKLNFLEIATIITKGLDDLMQSSVQLSDDGSGLITVIAQVSIHCREVFCVKDVVTGEILQGYEDTNPRDVTHLVRFEIVVRGSPELGLDIGRWQISDWDDLLDGNVWFI